MYKILAHHHLRRVSFSLPGEHGGGAKHAGVSRRHDGSRHSSQPEERDELGSEMLQHKRQDHGRLVGGQLAGWSQVAFEVSLVPG